MSADQQLIDEIFREKVLRARAMTPEEKFGSVYRLFEQACEVARAGIRDQYPDVDAAQIEKELERRLTIGRRLEEQSRGQHWSKNGS